MTKKLVVFALIVAALATLAWSAHRFDFLAFVKHLHGG